MKKYLLLLSFILTPFQFTVTAQTSDDMTKYPPDGKECEEYYNTLLDMYKKMYDSELGIKAYQALENFMLRANFDESLQDEKYQSLSGEDAMLTWIEDHLDQTQFKSMAEARELFQIKSDIAKQLRYENIGLYKYSKEAMQVCGSEIMTDVWKELQILYGAKRFMF